MELQFRQSFPKIRQDHLKGKDEPEDKPQYGMNQKKNKTSEYRLSKGVFIKMKNRFSDLKKKLDQEFKVF